jgi:hypothetical protein
MARLRQLIRELSTSIFIQFVDKFDVTVDVSFAIGTKSAHQPIELRKRKELLKWRRPVL